MMLAGYYLSRCSDPIPGGRSQPPSALRARTWKAAYDQFFDSLRGGRKPVQFRNSLKNVRDQYDIEFENGRKGWIDTHGIQHSLVGCFLRIHEEWKSRSDRDLEACVLGFLLIGLTTERHEMSSWRVLSEGGEKLSVSVRRERDPRLRAAALRIHGGRLHGVWFSIWGVLR